MVVSSFQRGVKELEDVTINESLRVVLFVIEDIKVEMQKSTAQFSIICVAEIIPMPTGSAVDSRWPQSMTRPVILPTANSESK